MHTWTAKNWMQYSTSHVASTALLLSQNGLRSNLRASSFPWRSMHTFTSDTHVTSRLKFLVIRACKYLTKNLQYVIPTFELLFFCRCLGIYGGLTSLLFVFSESPAVGCVQHSFMHLTPQNTYVAKCQPRYKKRCPDVVV